MNKNTYSSLRNAAFIALMCASSFSYAMDDDNAANGSRIERRARFLQMDEVMNLLEDDRVKYQKLLESVNTIMSNAVAISNNQTTISLNEIKQKREEHRFNQECRQSEQTEAMNYINIKAAFEEQHAKLHRTKMENQEIQINAELSRRRAESTYPQMLLQAVYSTPKVGIEQHAVTKEHNKQGEQFLQSMQQHIEKSSSHPYQITK